MSERELWAYAQELARRLGKDARAHALARVVELSDAGDDEGVIVWRLVLHRIAQLRMRPTDLVH
jgi:hypothetical protein